MSKRDEFMAARKHQREMAAIHVSTYYVRRNHRIAQEQDAMWDKALRDARNAAYKK